MSVGNTIWALVGLVLGIFGNYLFEGLGFKARAAKLNKRTAGRRLGRLRRELAQAEIYQGQPEALLVFLLVRLLLVSMLWISQEIVDYFMGLIANATYTYGVVGGRPVSEALTSSVNTVASTLGVVLLIFVLNTGYRAYNVWRRVRDFAKYKAGVEAEIADLNAIVSSSSACPGSSQSS